MNQYEFYVELHRGFHSELHRGFRRGFRLGFHRGFHRGFRVDSAWISCRFFLHIFTKKTPPWNSLEIHTKFTPKFTTKFTVKLITKFTPEIHHACLRWGGGLGVWIWGGLWG